jgi:hypothetical protein
MKLELEKEELEHIQKLLKIKPKPQEEPAKKWIDKEVKTLLKKYRTANKLF